MKQAGYSKRPQGRSPDRHRHHQKHTHGDFGDGKMRGNPQQSVEKYLILARDAASLGDPVTAENYYQYADHYYRVAIASRIPRPSSPERHQSHEDTQIPPLETVSAEASPQG